MRLLGLLAAFGAAMIFCSCYCGSVHPLYKLEDAIYLPELEGSWTCSRGSDTNFTIKRNDERSYLIESQNSIGGRSESIAVLLELGGELFLDVFPSDQSAHLASGQSVYAWPISVHYFYRILQIEPTLVVTTLDPYWLRQLHEKDPASIGFLSVTDPDDGPAPDDVINNLASDNFDLLTASTDELQQFVIAHLDTPEAWYDPATNDNNISQEFSRYTAETMLPAQKSIPLLDYTWKTLVGDNHLVSMDVLPQGGIVTCNDGGEVMFFSSSGSMLNSYELENFGSFSRIICTGDNQVIISGYNQVASFAEDGQFQWLYELPSELAFGIWNLVSTIEGPDDLLYVIHQGSFHETYYAGEKKGPRDSAVVALTRSGDVDHTFLAHPGLNSGGTFAENGLLCIVCKQQDHVESGRLQAYKPDGELVWTSESELYRGKPQKNSQGKLIACNSRSEIHALNDDGTIAWSFTKPGNSSSTTSWTDNSFALSKDDTIYIASGYMLYAIDVDGFLKWELDLGSRLEPPLLGPDGYLYCQARVPNRFQARFDGVAISNWRDYDPPYSGLTLLFRVTQEGDVDAIWMPPEPLDIGKFGSTGEIYGIANAWEFFENDLGERYSRPEVFRIDLP